MDIARVEFLKRLLSTPGPSSDEEAAARVWREEARQFELFRVAVFGHADGD